ncbi:endoribonuclease ysh1, partial [Teratosphaeriaceae sp. CCFEE 6253]
LFNESDILNTLPMVNTISFNTTHTHAGVKFTPYPAGHVLGACMYLIEIAGLNVLFTGDYSRETDRHLIPASVPRGVQVDCLITESTFGISTHVPRVERETALMKSITTILNRGGRALLPVFAIGRAQELLLILEDYWERHAEYQRFPIYYASSLARKCMVVYQTYIDAMNERIRSRFQAASLSASSASTTNPTSGTSPTTDSAQPSGAISGPWDFRFIRSLKSLDRFDDLGPCVMLASPGMLQNGVSRALLERWCPDPKNGVVITGYSVEGTMAKQILLEPDAIPAVMTARQGGGMPGAGGGKRAGGGAGGERVMLPRRCSVQEYSFAAHVDGSENREFVEQVGAPVVILVHGEKHNMNRLKSRLLGLQSMKVFSPANCEVLRVPFRREKVARVVGRLAEDGMLGAPVSEKTDGEAEVEDEVKRSTADGRMLSGVLVQNDFKLSLMAPEDLKEFAGLTTTTVVCRQRVTLATAGVELVKWSLEGTFGGVTIVPEEAEEKTLNGSANGTTNGTMTKRANGDGQEEEKTVMDVMGGAVRLTHRSPSGEVEVEWEGNVTNDSIADAVMAVLLSVESSPAAVRQSSKGHSHSHSHSHEHEEANGGYDAFGDSPIEKPRQNGAGGLEGEVGGQGMALRNPHAMVTPEEKLSRLFMFLEAQFGEDALSPIPTPRALPTNGDASHEGEDDTVAHEKAQATELARLHARGIPVPGLEIRVDKHVARVWLEDLEVECANKTLGDRVRAVVERGCGVVAPLWG